MTRSTRISRRRFLALAGGAIAVGMLAGCGSAAPAATMVKSSCEEESKMKKVLVTYASRAGSTAEVAQAIAERRCQRGESVDVRPVDEVKELSAYRAVVVGSAVRMGKWLPAAIKLVQQNQAALSAVPTAFFTVHMLNLDDSEASRTQRAAYAAPVKALLTPQHEAFFAGRIDSSKLGFLDRLAVKVVKVPEADRRDWPAIRAWGDQIFTN